jgi:hypothetical protein
MTKQELIDAVIKQIQNDLRGGDLTALEELLYFVPNTYLNNYLKEGDPKPKWIVCNGNLLEGHKFHGTFDTNEEACAWGEKNYNDSGFFTTEINQPIGG